MDTVEPTSLSYAYTLDNCQTLVQNNNRHKHNESKLQKKLRVTKVTITKEKRHSQRLASKVNNDSQTMHRLHQNIDDQLCKSEVQVN